MCMALFSVLENIRMSLRKGPCFQGPCALTQTVKTCFQKPTIDSNAI